MKYYHNRGFNQLCWFGILFGFVFPLGAIISVLWKNDIGSRLFYRCIGPYLFALLIVYLNRRSTSYAKITTSTVDAYSMFGRKYCSIALDEMVYFIPFKAYLPKSRFKGEYKPFIALSNQPFTYHNPNKVVNFIVRYDLHTIVVLPYDDRTKPLLPVEKWIQVV